MIRATIFVGPTNTSDLLCVKSKSLMETLGFKVTQQRGKTRLSCFNVKTNCFILRKMESFGCKAFSSNNVGSA